jgi:hypothetical protein
LKRVLCMNVYITHTHIIYWYIYILCVFVNMLYQQSCVNPCEPEKSEIIRTSTHFRFWLL